MQIQDILLSNGRFVKEPQVSFLSSTESRRSIAPPHPPHTYKLLGTFLPNGPPNAGHKSAAELKVPPAKASPPPRPSMTWLSQRRGPVLLSDPITCPHVRSHHSSDLPSAFSQASPALHSPTLLPQAGLQNLSPACCLLKSIPPTFNWCRNLAVLYPTTHTRRPPPGMECQGLFNSLLPPDSGSRYSEMHMALRSPNLPLSCN